MATMMPCDIGEFETEGEKTFYKFLEGVAKPDAHYLCWYLPEVNGKEPDFLLYSDEVGLIIFEVKDWALDQIVEANPHPFFLRINGRKQPRKNPFQQAHDYLVSIKDKIQKEIKTLKMNMGRKSSSKKGCKTGANRIEGDWK
ncbi:MAG: nuclease-related domain-containing protein [Thermodesulfobacteriota bacterium]|jgi:hypothetical protein